MHSVRAIATTALPASQITNLNFAVSNLKRVFATCVAGDVANAEANGGALFEIAHGCRGLPTQR